MTNSVVEQKITTPGQRLKYLRSLLRISRAYIQEKYGIPEVTLKTWENESVNLTETGAKRCIEAYRSEGLIVSKDWIMEGIGLDPASAATVSRYFAIPTDKELPLEDDEICMIKDANTFKETYSNAVVMIVSGEEMRPFYKAGDYVGGKTRHGTDIENTVNKDCIVLLKDGERYFRRLIKNASGNYNLTCLNPNENIPEPVLFNVKIDSVAPVIWHRWKEEF